MRYTGLNANIGPMAPGQLKFPKTASGQLKKTLTGPTGPVNIWGHSY